MTHDHGNIYQLWHKANVGIAQLKAEIAEEQVKHPMHLYTPGSPQLERLYAAMELAQRFQWKEAKDV